MGSLKDLSGQKFGELTVISRDGSDKRGRATWLCSCSCGKSVVVQSYLLLSEMTKSCGHLKGCKKDISGQRFGRLVAIREVGRTWQMQVKWLCQCDCGNTVEVITRSLTGGNTESCGCYHKDVVSSLFTTHGLSYTREYRNAKWTERDEKEHNLDSEWTPEMEIALCNLQQRCVVCGGSKHMSTDHVQALSLGFGLKPGNAVRLCRSCNSKKNDKPLDKLPATMRYKISQSANEFLEHWNSASK